jgi:adenosylcobinamide kinase/adenosylcobinamide-phosphate guanylyltransferase
VLIGGGARSGKSSLALSLARKGGARAVFLATAEARDDEMKGRISRHQAERGAAMTTLEEPIAVARVLAAVDADLVLVDCLTLWLSNLLCAGLDDAAIERAVDELVAVVAQRRISTVLVTNEVGLGIVPESALARRFRDLAGTTHRRLAAEADEVYFAAMGLCLRIKPSSLLVEPG